MNPLVLVLLLALPPAPAPVSAPQTTPEPTIPSDRLGWIQDTAGAPIGQFAWVVFIDGARQPLAASPCAPRAQANSFDCSAPMPAMTPGVRVLELVAIRTVSGLGVESPRSAPFPVESLGATVAPVGLRIIRAP